MAFVQQAPFVACDSLYGGLWIRSRYLFGKITVEGLVAQSGSKHIGNRRSRRSDALPTLTQWGHPPTGSELALDFVERRIAGGALATLCESDALVAVQR